MSLQKKRNNKIMSVIIVSSDEVRFEVPKDVAFCSEVVKSLLMDATDYSEAIPVYGVDSETMKVMFEFCEHHMKDPLPVIDKPLRSNIFSEIVPPWYDAFMEKDHSILFKLAEAANYMDVPPLLNLVCAKIACMIKDKSVEDIRATFNIPNNFTPEEEAAFQEESKWCEDA